MQIEAVDRSAAVETEAWRERRGPSKVAPGGNGQSSQETPRDHGQVRAQRALDASPGGTHRGHLRATLRSTVSSASHDGIRNSPCASNGVPANVFRRGGRRYLSHSANVIDDARMRSPAKWNCPPRRSCSTFLASLYVA